MGMEQVCTMSITTALAEMDQIRSSLRKLQISQSADQLERLTVEGGGAKDEEPQEKLPPSNDDMCVEPTAFEPATRAAAADPRRVCKLRVRAAG